MTTQSQPRIVVLGGGFGGLESAFYLRMMLQDRVRITLVSDQDHFLFKPNTIYIPFGLDPGKLKFKLARPAKRRNITLVQARANEIDPVTRNVYLQGFSDDARIPYDFLVVATGADMNPEEIPGLGTFANTIWTPQEMLRLRASFQQLLADAREGGVNGRRQKVLFLVPPNNKCSGPLYEMVMMLDTWLRRKKVRNSVDITWSTYEESYIQAFGPRLHELVSAEFSQRGIAGHNRYVVDWVDSNEVAYRNGERLPYDLLVSFPPYAASTRFDSLPLDARGFIATDLESRQVAGYPEVYAVGDASDFPVKQAFLAFLQADAAAEHVSAQILGTQPQVHFDPVSMCVMEEFDKATFAQVPLQLTGRSDRPVEVRQDAVSMYKVGTSGLWRLGKMALGIYLPWRFKAGNPFHAGVPWKGMEVGLKLMSGLLAG